MEEFKLGKETCLEDENISNWQTYEENSDSDASFVDCEMPELVSFELESEYQIVKDICIDRAIPSPGRCSVENCELDHSIISCLLNADEETDGKLTPEALNRVPSISNSLDCLSEHVKQCDSTENSTSARLLLVGDLDAQLSNSNGDRVEPKHDKVPLEGPITFALGYEIETRSITYDGGPSSTSINNENKPVPEGTKYQPPLTIGDMFQLHDEDQAESSFSAVGPVSGPISKSGSISFRSNSCSSTRSFTFPVLPWEWNDSPKRMVEANMKNLKKHRRWKSVISLCCKF